MIFLNTTPTQPLLLPRLFHHHHHTPLSSIKPISAASSSSSSPRPVGIIPSTTPPKQTLYQPFRPPPPPLPPQFANLDVPSRLDILTNRLGLWFEYAPLITSLATTEGFSPSSLEEITGISGVEQSCLVVAAQVRQSLSDSGLEPEILSYFDKGGAEILYEIRLLSVGQRVAAARYLVEKRFDGKGARDVARAIKDFLMRKGDEGWESFEGSIPGDCLSFMYFRQSMEHETEKVKRIAALESALEYAVSEGARRRVLEELEGKGNRKEDVGTVIGVKVPVVRLHVGEVAESTSVVVLPVCRADDRDDGVLRAPFECRTEGEFGVVVTEKGWDRWVVLPSWEPLVGLEKGGVVVSFADARALPWRANRWYKEEPVLVVVDRENKDVMADEGFYLVVKGNDGRDGRGGELKVQRGLALKEDGVAESLGTVVLVVRPPKEDDDGQQLSDEDWD